MNLKQILSLSFTMLFAAGLSAQVPAPTEAANMENATAAAKNLVLSTDLEVPYLSIYYVEPNVRTDQDIFNRKPQVIVRITCIFRILWYIIISSRKLVRSFSVFKTGSRGAYRISDITNFPAEIYMSYIIITETAQFHQRFRPSGQVSGPVRAYICPVSEGVRTQKKRSRISAAAFRV